MEFETNLSRSEALYKYIQIPNGYKEEFPEKDINFTLIFKNKKYKVWTSAKKCFMISKLYHVYEFQQGDEIKVVKKDKDTFELSLIS